MNNPKILLVYNPKAGKCRVSQELESIITALVSEGCQVTACPVLVHQPVVSQQLERLASQLDGVVCCGGDGTLHHIVQLLHSQNWNLPVGYLPYGYTNDFAASVGIGGDIASICRRIAQMQPRFLDLGQFGPESFSYVAAFGMFTEVSYQTPQTSKNLMGHLAYLMEGVRRLDLSKGWRAAIKADNTLLEGEFWYGSVSNSTSIGGMTVPKAEEVALDDGLFELMLVRKPQTLAELSRLVSSLVSQRVDDELVHFIQAKEIEFLFDQPTAWSLDGEEGPQVKEVTIRCIPNGLALLNGTQVVNPVENPENK